MNASGKSPRRQRPLSGVPIPPEGSDGLFTQSWFAVCLASEVTEGAIFSTEFLGGKIIVIRDAQGAPKVLSGYCVHMGADLANATMINGHVRCPFHHWQYDSDGQCVRTGIGDPAPKRARLFQFPAEERCGVIFAFNGEEPLYPLPNPFGNYEADELLWVVKRDYRAPWPVDPWVVRANTPDWQHFRFVHHMNWDDAEGPGPDAYRWNEHSINLDTTVTLDDSERSQLEYHIQITGTSFWHQHGALSGRWNMSMSALGLPKPGWCDHYFACAVHKGDGTRAAEEAAQAFLDELLIIFEKMLDEDDVLLRSLRYRPGLLTKADAAVAKYLHYIRKFPRANPAGDFIC